MLKMVSQDFFFQDHNEILFITISSFAFETDCKHAYCLNL